MGIVALIAVIVLLWQNWDQVSQWLSESWNWLLGAATSAFSAIGEFISGVWNSIVEWTVSTWNSVVDTVQERMNAAKQWVIEIWNEAQAFLEGIDLFQVGKDIIQGLINGIGDMAGKLWGKVTEIAGGIKDAITGFWKTASPSKLAIEIGGDIGAGFGIGLDNSIVDVSNSALDLAESANPEYHNQQALFIVQAVRQCLTITIRLNITVMAAESPRTLNVKLKRLWNGIITK